MFCSNCGKTIRQDDDACQHCGARLGEGRFYGNTYTSSQVRLPVNALADAPQGGIAYTRTNYMSFDNQPQDDVYSNTTYRPLLTDEEDLTRQEAEEEAARLAAEAEARAAEEAARAEAEAAEAEAEQAAFEEEAPAAEEDAQPAPASEEEAEYQEEEEEPEDVPSTSPLPPLKKAAISPRVLSYMAELEDKEQRKNSKGGSSLRLPAFLNGLGAKKSAAPADEPEEPEEEYSEEYDESAYAPETEEAEEEFTGASDESEELVADYDDESLETEETFYSDEADDTDSDDADEADYSDEYIATEDDYEYYEDEEEEEASEKRGLPPFLANLDVKSLLQSRMLKIIVASVLIVAVVIGGVIWLRFVTTKRARIANVTYSAYSQGIELLKTNIGEEYRNEMTQTYLTNTSYANSAFAEDMTALNALLPAEPQDNDPLFVTTLTIIQDAIADAIKADADAELNGATAERAATSERDWQAIANAVTTLEEATSAGQLSSIVGTLESIVAPTPSPTPAPTAPNYTTLQNGMMDSVPVKQMQMRLINLGFLSGEADGDFGNGTENAVKAFQRAAGLPENGVASPETQEAIYASDAPRNGAAVTATPSPDTDNDGTVPADPSAAG